MNATVALGNVRRATSELNLGQVALAVFSNPWALLICKLTIGIVSAYDIFLTIKYVDSLPTMELNPLGRWLMMLDRGPECELHQIASFVAAKFAGNFLVIAVIELLANWKRYMAGAVAIPVAAFQVALFCFLTFDSVHDWVNSMAI